MARVHRQDEVTIVELDPEYDSLDESVLQQIHDLLVALAQTAVPPLLVLDLSRTTFMGSGFIEMIFRAWKRLVARQGRLVLCGLQPYCAEVLKATRLDTLWESRATREEAVVALRTPSPAA